MDGVRGIVEPDWCLVQSEEITTAVSQAMRESLPFNALRVRIAAFMKDCGHCLIACDRQVTEDQSGQMVRIIVLYYSSYDPQFPNVVEVQEWPAYTKAHPICTW